MRRSVAGLVVAIAAVALTPSTASAAAPRSLAGLHNARYCEIFEIKGALPSIRVTVWNTIGLNRCPAAWWKGFEPAALARELGVTAVLLNGPRHFLMDSVSARTGGVRSFHGQRLRNVASIPIRTAADLSQVPYTDRTIKRRNTWRWKRGRRIYELVAPGGDVYVMQSYAQIRDPALKLGQLRKLGPRLKLPAGWRYRTRRLRRSLALIARGEATIIQDDLLNTYQLAKRARRPAKRKRHRVSFTGKTRTVTPTTPGTVEDHGTITGAPFGRGSIVLVGRFAGAVLTGTVQIVSARGSASASVSLPFTISGNEISFRGTARFTSGTGIYRGITSGELQVRDRNTLDGQAGTVSVEGYATY